MPTPIYPSWNDKEYDLLKKMTENTALIADYEIGDVASVAGTANQLLVNGGTAAATGNITLSLPSTLIAPGNLTVNGTGTTGGNLRVRNALGYATGIHTGTTSDSTQQLLLSSNAAYNHAYISKGSTALGIGFSSDNGSFVADDSITITAATKLVTLAGNLTVSGRDLTLGSSESVIYFGTPSANYLYYNGSSLFLRVGSVDRITIPASTGNILIGTTTDGGQKLQVSGTAYVSGNATFAGTIALTGSSAGQVATWNSSNANGIYHTYLTNGTAIGDIGSAAQAVSGSASDFGITSRAGKLVLGTSSAARLTIDTSGNLIAAVTGTAPTLGTNSTMTFELTSNTSLTIKVRGTDGTTRSVALTLA